MKKIYWKDIPSYEGIYQGSNYGDIKSLHFNHSNREGILKEILRKDGYYQVGLCKDGKNKNIFEYIN